MEYEELNKLVKYCSNQVNHDKFIEFMMPRYNDESYISNLWSQFRDNPTMFIVARSEVELFENIQKEMNKINYKG